MDAEIIAIGTELTSGAKLDTNSQWLSLQLADLGIPVVYHTTVADDLAANVDVLRCAVNRVDLVLLTGGLGPTRDDLTRYALAQLDGGELILEQESLEQLEQFFASRGREMPERNKVQAMFPLGSQPLANPIGTAPGIWMPIPRNGQTPCIVACFPGVPTEMKKMFLEQVKPRLPGGQRVIRRARINCFGLGESATEELLGELTERGNDPEVGITAHDATITLRIIAHGQNATECETKIARATTEVYDKLSDYIFGVEDEQLEDVVIARLRELGKKLRTVESGTRGLMTHWLAKVPENQGVYQHGSVQPQLDDPQPFFTNPDTDFVLVIGEETLSEENGRPLSSIPIWLWGADVDGDVTQIDLTWNGNPNITHSRAVKTALNLLWKRIQP